MGIMHGVIMVRYPSRLSASLTLNIDLSSSRRTRSSLSILILILASYPLGGMCECEYLASFLTSSPSTCSEAFGVTASRTKWLSQWGQYSSLRSTQYSLHSFELTCIVPVLKLTSVLAKAFFALFAGKSHIEALHEGVIRILGMALGAVEPFPACEWRLTSFP